MSIIAIFASLTLLFAVLILVGFVALRPPKCPRCGTRNWVPCKHLGPFVVYCRECAKFLDFSDPKRPVDLPRRSW